MLYTHRMKSLKRCLLRQLPGRSMFSETFGASAVRWMSPAGCQVSLLRAGEEERVSTAEEFGSYARVRFHIFDQVFPFVSFVAY